jgi:hypothetical protein
MGIPDLAVFMLGVGKEAIITLETSLATVGAPSGQHVTMEAV